MTQACPRLRVFAGPNGSGKSTILPELKAEWIGVYVNADEIEKTLKQAHRLDLSGFDITAPIGTRLHEHFESSTLLQKAGLIELARQVQVIGSEIQFGTIPINSYLAASIADFIRRELLSQGTSFTFESVMSHPDKVEFMREAQAKGYRTYLYFVATNSPAINIARVRQRVAGGGHPVPEEKIIERYSNSIALLDQAVAAANRAYIFDNSGDAHVLLVQSNEGELTTCVDALPQWFVQSPLWVEYGSSGSPDPT